MAVCIENETPPTYDESAGHLVVEYPAIISVTPHPVLRNLESGRDADYDVGCTHSNTSLLSTSLRVAVACLCMNIIIPGSGNSRHHVALLLT